MSVRLYNHHIRQSPYLLPVLDDPEQGLAKIGLLRSTSDNLYTTSQSVASELNSSIKVQELRKPDVKPTVENPKSDPVVVKTDSSTKCKEIAYKWNVGEECLFEDEVGQRQRGCVDWRFRNNNDIPLYIVESIDKSVRITVGEEKLYPLALSESNSDPLTGEANAIVEETNNQEEFNSLDNSSPSEDDVETGFSIGQAVIAWMEEDRSWKFGVIHNTTPANIFIVKLDSGEFAGVPPSHLKVINFSTL